MPLPLSTAKAAKSMPSGKGTYGSKRGRPAKKKAPAKGAKKGQQKSLRLPALRAACVPQEEVSQEVIG